MSTINRLNTIESASIVWVGMGVGLAIILEKLKALSVSKLQEPGYYGDGGGLWLQVSKTGTKSWIFRYTMNKKQREMGLGSLLFVSLAAAREKAKACRMFVLDGVDPLAEKQSRVQQLAVAGRTTPRRSTRPWDRAR